MSEKIEALAKFLNVEVDKINEESGYGEFSYENEEYLVFTDDEADQYTEQNIRDSLWAFNTDFILNHSKIEWSSRVEKAFQKMQQELCEDANEIVFAVLDDFDDFVQEAIGADGRGHFLAGYDSEENEMKVNDTWYYIYRTN